LEAAIKTAQEAAESANRERLIWQEKINELNTQKQVLQMNLSVYENEKPEKDINMSHNFQNDIISFSEMQSKSEIPTEFMNIIDPNLIMLKFNFNDEFNSTSKYM
ncbi:hypothetical protein WN48_06208, partial [Eufriesea mexicana]